MPGGTSAVPQCPRNPSGDEATEDFVRVYARTEGRSTERGASPEEARQDGASDSSFGMLMPDPATFSAVQQSDGRPREVPRTQSDECQPEEGDELVAGMAAAQLLITRAVAGIAVTRPIAAPEYHDPGARWPFFAAGESVPSSHSPTPGCGLSTEGSPSDLRIGAIERMPVERQPAGFLPESGNLFGEETEAQGLPENRKMPDGARASGAADESEAVTSPLSGTFPWQADKPIRDAGNAAARDWTQLSDPVAMRGTKTPAPRPLQDGSETTPDLRHPPGTTGEKGDADAAPAQAAGQMQWRTSAAHGGGQGGLRPDPHLDGRSSTSNADLVPSQDAAVPQVPNPVPIAAHVPAAHKPTVDVAPGPSRVAEQLAAAVSLRADGADVALRPEELGHVRISIERHGAEVSVTLVAERAETVELMRRHVDLLASEFRAAGFDTCSFQFGHGQRDGQTRALPADSPVETDQVEPPATTSAAPPTLGASARQGLDMRL
ncbi:flagellar hook-length control protein FliK [Defluviimonas sp. WL0002]|uniref:Flagellar hook-length control protein FliK n=1 Tax=Albidovulum marisflavi TaxID=2984159 RepID=A0ABT2Z7C7_9RHOB|nr:flagellar hook-length control protein FliK [Defluviimonas sp. WL0002]MCV2867044.1 flagellar hook-length control protein FliK [Defluviimonas sp. WL0002]